MRSEREKPSIDLTVAANDRIAPLFQIVASCGIGDEAVCELDPWKMRNEFLEIENEPKRLARFLSKWGTWDNSLFFDPPDEAVRRSRDAKKIADTKKAKRSK
jgi:hypothetical protein